MKFYLFGTLRTRFLIQLVLLAGFFVSVSVVQADIITFRYEGEITHVATPLEGQFSVGDDFGGTYTFESNTASTYTESQHSSLELFSNAIKSMDFSSGSFITSAESGDI